MFSESLGLRAVDVQYSMGQNSGISELVCLITNSGEALLDFEGSLPFTPACLELYS